MFLSQACKYGLRAIVYLAQHGERPRLSQEIARELQIPKHFLAKILQDLSKNRLLFSYKGRGGGFKLARPAREIKLLEVIAAIEGPQFGQGCLLGLPECSDDSPCPLHYQWTELKDSILRALEATSIQHVIEKALPPELT